VYNNFHINKIQKKQVETNDDIDSNKLDICMDEDVDSVLKANGFVIRTKEKIGSGSFGEIFKFKNKYENKFFVVKKSII